MFSKAGALANQVTLSMATETPIVVTYHIMNSCGEIKYYLAPKITEEEWFDKATINIIDKKFINF